MPRLSLVILFVLYLASISVSCWAELTDNDNDNGRSTNAESVDNHAVDNHSIDSHLVDIQTGAANKPLDVIDIDSAFSMMPLLGRIETAEDKLANWSLAEAAQQSYTPLTKKSFGFSNSAIWARFRVANKDLVDRALVLDIADRVFTHVALYVLPVAGNDSSAILKNNRPTAIYGTALPFAERAVKSRTIAFPLLIRADQTLDIYLRIDSDTEIHLEPQLYSDAAFHQHQYFDDVSVYLFYGAMTALLIFNLILAFGLKDITSFACVALVVTWTLLGAASVGVVYQWWPAGLGVFQVRYIYMPVGVVFFLLALFTTSYLELNRYHRNFARLQYTIMVIAAIFSGAMWLLSMQQLRNVTITLFVVVLFSEIIAAYLLVRRGSYYARNYLLGYTGMFVSLLIATGAFYLPGNNFQNVSFSGQLPTALLLVAFTFGVVDRIRRLKNEARESQLSAGLARTEAEFKSRFLVTMSHEIRTPLNGVVGMIELLRETSLNDVQKRYADVIGASGRALMEVINNVLDFSKLESGKVNLEYMGINLEYLIDECINVFAITKKSGRIAFNACIEPEVPLQIMGDPTRLKQIIINLVSNAFKFTEIGEVNLSVRLATNPQHPTVDPKLIFSVTDTGVGMNEQARQQLFTAFTQADGSIARKYGGTGLGLAICKQLIELMGGEAGVESQVDVGSTFWFTLPLALPSEGTVFDPLALAPMLVGKRVLVIDDHDAFCHSMRVALESFGMQVTIAQSAQTAHDAIFSESGAFDDRFSKNFDVLLIDRCLPDRDGLDFARDIRQRLMSNAPVMLLVTLALDILADSTLADAGIAVHLIKPISLSNLRNRLARLLDTSAAEQTNAPNVIVRSTQRVLVAEDNGVNQIVLNGMLAKLGIAALFVGDGKQAIDHYLESILSTGRAYDVIIMDYDMPVMDGVTATRYIRQYEMKHGVTEPVRIIGLTAHVIEEYRSRGIAAGMDKVLAKPIVLDELRKIFAIAN